MTTHPTTPPAFSSAPPPALRPGPDAAIVANANAATDTAVRTVAQVLDAGAGRIANLQRLLRSDDIPLADCAAQLAAACDAGEFTALAELLLAADCRSAIECGSTLAQSEGGFELCRDAVKTVLLSEAAPTVRVPVDAVHGTPVATGDISVFANDMLHLVLGRGSVTIDCYRIASEPSGQPALHRDGARRTLRSGEMFSAIGSREAVEIVAADPGTWLLRVVRSEHGPLVQHFDRVTLRRCGTSSANMHASRIEFVLDLFKRFGHSEAAETVETLQSSSRFHFVRWKAVQTLLHLDYGRGQAALQRALADPHPQLRRAAATTLANLERAQAQEGTTWR
ncbi:HEAT repeat domain-containing protein [Montanilutibacter psychrotolerans]|uniref:HEAT repeat domain-containing protein n=1 Tax=Montanilutibacter psychrotolerans TaxID=1327343 RepID=A0A3M8SNH6_9GAMM|nr:HEAT repeat domain-containing protein [Lysobacter psychrotolerans]RNF82857.1 HEAT repeat domain-containing protein [Lysobacter psychrotolerans]